MKGTYYWSTVPLLLEKNNIKLGQADLSFDRLDSNRKDMATVRQW
jgi:hypothetical protein